MLIEGGLVELFAEINSVLEIRFSSGLSSEYGFEVVWIYAGSTATQSICEQLFACFLKELHKKVIPLHIDQTS